MAQTCSRLVQALASRQTDLQNEDHSVQAEIAVATEVSAAADAALAACAKKAGSKMAASQPRNFREIPRGFLFGETGSCFHFVLEKEFAP